MPEWKQHFASAHLCEPDAYNDAMKDLRDRVALVTAGSCLLRFRSNSLSFAYDGASYAPAPLCVAALVVVLVPRVNKSAREAQTRDRTISYVELLRLGSAAEKAAFALVFTFQDGASCLAA
jgi:hypothetical protein